MYADVIPEEKVGSDHDFFTYKIPDNLSGKIKVGSIVKIPLGKIKSRGVVLKIHNNVPKYATRDVTEIDDNFKLDKEYLEIVKWISDYYLCSFSEAVGLFLPPEMVRPRANKEQGTRNKGREDGIFLSDDQEKIFQSIKANLNSKNKKPALIHGVTGSGKTEIYIKLAQEYLKIGKQVVVLVPEIILTPQTIERFDKLFHDQICLMHSGLSKSEKFECYRAFYSGEKLIIVGPRSALLVPSINIGLIIVDEEQEDAYKQDQKPRYHAVDLSLEIGRVLSAQVVLGSATPRIETYYKAKNGIFDFYELKSRYKKDILPPATIVDLRDEIKNDNSSPVSILLQKEMAQVLDQKKQILLFLNRRGTSTFVSCRECGFIALCPNCSIPMVYHTKSGDNQLRCHHCNTKSAIPHRCPDCGSLKIKFFGAGVEKIEKEIVSLFPDSRVARVDSETIKSKNDYNRFYKDFVDGNIDIVIGTQMIAKGFDIPGVDLVGVISADTGLHMPHYKSSEKTFQILTQVSGRSGRRDHIGRTILQSYWPDSGAINAASKHDFDLFYNQEIVEREKFSYPPFTHLVRIISENTDKDRALANLEKVVPNLEKDNFDFIGPGICFYSKLHNKYRYHIVIKLQNLPNNKMHQIAKDHPSLTFDVDPVNLL